MPIKGEVYITEFHGGTKNTILFYGKFLYLGSPIAGTAFRSYYWEKIKDGLLSADLTKTQMASRLSSDTFAPFSEIFAMQITVQDSFGYTNIYVCHAKQIAIYVFKGRHCLFCMYTPGLHFPWEDASTAIV